MEKVPNWIRWAMLAATVMGAASFVVKGDIVGWLWPAQVYYWFWLTTCLQDKLVDLQNEKNGKDS